MADIEQFDPQHPGWAALWVDVAHPVDAATRAAYLEVAQTRGEGAAERAFPEFAAHLGQGCQQCRDDLHELRRLIAEDGPSRPAVGGWRRAFAPVAAAALAAFVVVYLLPPYLAPTAVDLPGTAPTANPLSGLAAQSTAPASTAPASTAPASQATVAVPAASGYAVGALSIKNGSPSAFDAELSGSLTTYVVHVPAGQTSEVRLPAGSYILRVESQCGTVSHFITVSASTSQQYEVNCDIAEATPRPRTLALPTRVPGSFAPPPFLRTPTPSPESQKTYVRIANTGGIGLYLRRTPDMSDTLVAWPEGTLLEIVGSDQFANGRLWRRVQDPAGNVGWVPAVYIVEVNN